MSPPPFIDWLKGDSMSKRQPADDNTPISAKQRERFAELEQVVAVGVRQSLDAVIAAGRALAEIRDGQLYRMTPHKSWAAYVRFRWNMPARRADQLIVLAGVTNAIEELSDETGSVVPKVTERAARPLAGLDDAQVRDAVREAAASDGGITPSSLAKAAARRKPRRAGPPRPVRLKIPGGVVEVALSRRGVAMGTTVVDALTAALKVAQGDDAESRDAAA